MSLNHRFNKKAEETLNDKKVGKNHSLLSSSRTAIQGFLTAVRTEKKVRQVILAMTIATALCVMTDVGYFQILMVIFSWVIVLICEIFNTALEKVLDYTAGKEFHPLVRDGKDYAAACTFISILFAGSLCAFLIWDRLF